MTESVGEVFKTTTTRGSPLSGRVASPGTALQANNPDKEAVSVSDFLTVQSFGNFAATTGAVSAAWKGLQAVGWSWASSRWVPFCFALAFAAVSVASSWTDLGRSKPIGVFIAIVNGLVLTSAVVGLTAST